MIDLTWADADVHIDETGALSLAVDGLTYLGGWRPHQLVLGLQGGSSQPLGPPTVQWLPDEVELAWVVPVTDGELTVTGRHVFGMVWSQRWVIRSSGPAPGVPVFLEFGVTGDVEVVCWVFGAGAESSLSLQPFNPQLPVLGAVAVQGAIVVRQEQIALGPYQLGALGSGVVELRADLYPHAAAFGRTVHDWLPPTTYFRAGEVVVITHPDAALTDPAAGGSSSGATGASVGSGTPAITDVVDPLPPADQVLAALTEPTRSPDAGGTVADDLDDGEPGEPGERGGSEFVDGSDSERLLVFHGARGRTELTLHWAKPLEAAIGAAARAALGGDRAANGTPALPDPQAGLLVQRALAEHAEIDPDQAEDALDLLAVRSADTSPWQVMFDCAEFHRTGEDDQLIRAHATFLRSDPRAGLGMAASRLVVALLSVGRNPVPVLQHLERARQRAVDEDVRLELALVAGTVFGAAHEVESADSSARQLAQVAARLGSGLRGRSVPDVAPVDRARLLTLLSLLPELAVLWQDRLAALPGALAQYAANRVLYELEVGPGSTPADRQALVWLSLATDA